MVVRIRRTFVFWQRMLHEETQHQLHRLFQLRVVPLTDRSRIEIDLDVGRDADVFDFPLAVEAIERRSAAP